MSVPMSIDVVLATVKDKLLPSSHSSRFSNSVFMVLVMLLTSFAECVRLVSSAYIVTLEHFNTHANHEYKGRTGEDQGMIPEGLQGDILSFRCYSIDSTALLPNP